MKHFVIEWLYSITSSTKIWKYACLNVYLIQSIYCVQRLIHKKFDNLCIMIASQSLMYKYKGKVEGKDEKLVSSCILDIGLHFQVLI